MNGFLPMREFAMLDDCALQGPVTSEAFPFPAEIHAEYRAWVNSRIGTALGTLATDHRLSEVIARNRAILQQFLSSAKIIFYPDKPERSDDATERRKRLYGELKLGEEIPESAELENLRSIIHAYACEMFMKQFLWRINTDRVAIVAKRREKAVNLEERENELQYGVGERPKFPEVPKVTHRRTNLTREIIPDLKKLIAVYDEELSAIAQFLTCVSQHSLSQYLEKIDVTKMSEQDMITVIRSFIDDFYAFINTVNAKFQKKYMAGLAIPDVPSLESFATIPAIFEPMVEPVKHADDASKQDQRSLEKNDRGLILAAISFAILVAVISFMKKFYSDGGNPAQTAHAELAPAAAVSSVPEVSKGLFYELCHQTPVERAGPEDTASYNKTLAWPNGEFPGSFEDGKEANDARFIVDFPDKLPENVSGVDFAFETGGEDPYSFEPFEAEISPDRKKMIFEIPSSLKDLLRNKSGSQYVILSFKRRPDRTIPQKLCILNVRFAIRN